MLREILRNAIKTAIKICSVSLVEATTRLKKVMLSANIVPLTNIVPLIIIVTLAKIAMTVTTEFTQQYFHNVVYQIITVFFFFNIFVIEIYNLLGNIATHIYITTIYIYSIAAKFIINRKIINNQKYYTTFRSFYISFSSLSGV